MIQFLWMHAAARILFVALMAMHVALWPSPLTIFVASVYGILGILQFASLQSRGTSAQKEFFWTPGVFIMQSNSAIWFGLTVGLSIYFAAFFLAFINHESTLQASSTWWIYPTLLSSYSFTKSDNNAFSGSGTGAESVEMRSNPFVWSQSFDYTAPLVIGNIPNAGPGGGVLHCADPKLSGLTYACYAPKLLPQTAPTSMDGVYAKRPFVPLPSDFYDIDVRIVPSTPTNCNALEVYRVNLDTERGIAHPLDYPGSTSTHNATGATQTFTGVFSDPTWTLGVQHTFSNALYQQKVQSKCTAEGQTLVIRLPSRNEDVNPDTARIALDILVVTTGAKVDVHATWNADDESQVGVLGMLKQVVTTDSLQDWRVSSESKDIALRFAIAVTPFLICWYYVIVTFEDNACANPVIFVCSTVLLPAALIFLAVGAWIPTIGCVLGVVALNYKIDIDAWKSKQKPAFSEIQRQFFLFVMALCNSIHFVWVLVVIAQAGYSAFLYELSLNQIYNMTQSFLVSTGVTPTLMAIMLPSVLALLLAMLITTAICIVLEVMAHRNGGKMAASVNARSDRRQRWAEMPLRSPLYTTEGGC